MKTVTIMAIGASFAAAAFAAPAHAAEVDMNQVLTDLDNKPMTTDGKPDGEKMTLRLVAERALLASYADETSLTADKKGQRFSLALKIHTADKIALTAEDTSLVELVVGKAYPPLIVGRVTEILDPAVLKK